MNEDEIPYLSVQKHNEKWAEIIQKSGQIALLFGSNTSTKTKESEFLSTSSWNISRLWQRFLV